MVVTIPAEALTRHIAILGSTGSGKTTAAKSGVVEPILSNHGRVLVIDPTAAWWGLRLAANGKKAGFPIYIFGGDHGDYPLRAKDSSALAEAFGTSSDSAIFDTSLMTVSDRSAFFMEFSLALLRKNRGPVNLVIDEGHLFMPQVGARTGGMVPAMLHAGNNLVSLGRSKGIRVTMISQRPAKLHKDSLTQAQSLVAMRVLAPQDRKAIGEWIAEQADPDKGKEIIASLSGLKAGEAWVWAPLQEVLEKVQFPLPKTFDSSKAPDEHSGSGPVLAPINLDALKSRLSAIEAETKANDPRTLKAEIALLKAEIRTLRNAIANEAEADPKMIEDAERRGFQRGWDARLKELAHAANRMRAHEDEISKIAHLLNELSVVITTDYCNVGDVSTVASPITARYPQPNKKPMVIRQPAAKTLSTSNGHLSTPQQKVADSLQFWRSIGHESPTREQVAAVAGYAPGSGNFNNILGGMKSEGMIDYPAPGTVALAQDVGRPITHEEAADRLNSILNVPQKKVIKPLVNGDTLTREELAAASDYSAGSGNFNNILGSLSSIKLVRYPSPGRVELADWAAELLL